MWANWYIVLKRILYKPYKIESRMHAIFEYTREAMCIFTYVQIGIILKIRF